MNITLYANGKPKNYSCAKLLSIVEGEIIFFKGKYKNNAVKIPLNGEHVEIEIKIKESKGE